MIQLRNLQSRDTYKETSGVTHPLTQDNSGTLVMEYAVIIDVLSRTLFTLWLSKA